MSEPVIENRTIAGLNTAFAHIGEGPPVVLLHGWDAQIKSFWPVADQLAPLGYAVYVLDLPGFGASEAPLETWSVADYMHFVIAFLDALDLGQVAVIGHSFGGRIALMLAAEHPDRVSKMVLANSAGLRTPPTVAQLLRGFAAKTVRATLDTLGLSALRERLQANYNQRYASEDYLNAGALRETFLQVIGQDLTEFAVRVQAPTVLIWGDQDTDTPLWQGQKLEQLIPDAGLIIFQGAGHFSYLDRLPDFVRITDHFLSNQSQPT